MPQIEKFGQPCWTSEGVSNAVTLIAKVADDRRHYFLATHSPIEGITGGPGAQERFTEEELFQEIFGNSEREQLAVAVVGFPGAGKSHLIHWLKLRWEVEQVGSTTNLIPVMVKRRSGSLKDALEQIVEQLPGEFSRYLTPLQTAVGEITHAEAKEKLADAFALKIQFLGEGFPLPNRLGELREVFRSRGFRKWLCRDDGTLDNLVKRLSGQSNADERAELPQFGPQDFLPDSQHQTNNTPDVLDLIDEFRDDKAHGGDDGSGSPSILAQAAGACNHVAKRATAELTGVGGADLMEMLRAIRRDLHEKGHGFALFIEDVSVLGPLDHDIVLAATEPGEKGWQLRVVLGMTQAGWGALPENQQQRLNGGEAYYIDSAVDEWRENPRSLAAFTARYLNAARSDEALLERWAVGGLIGQEDAPNACGGCSVREHCHEVFGAIEVDSDRGPIGLFPFSEHAPHRLLANLDESRSGLRNNPRGFLENILRKLLDGAGQLREGQFPQLDGMPVQVSGGLHWADFGRQFLGGFSADQKKQVENLAGAWVAEPADAASLAASLKPFLGPLQLPEFSAEVASQSDRGGGDSPVIADPAPARAVATDDELENELAVLANWLAGEPLIPDEKHRERVLKFLRNSFPLENNPAVPRDAFKGCFGNKGNIYIDGQTATPQAGRFRFVLECCEETRALLEALARFEYSNKQARGMGWGFAGGEAHRRAVHCWLRRHEQRVADAVEPEELDPKIPIQAAAQALYLGAAVRQRRASSDAVGVVETVFAAEGTEGGEAQNAGDWRTLLRCLHNDRERLVEFLEGELAARQGATGGTQFINPLPILSAVDQFLEARTIADVPAAFNKKYWGPRYANTSGIRDYPRVPTAVAAQFQHARTKYAACKTTLEDFDYRVGDDPSATDFVREALRLNIDLQNANSPVPYDPFDLAKRELSEFDLDECFVDLGEKVQGTTVRQLAEFDFSDLTKVEQVVSVVSGYVQSVEKEVDQQEKALEGAGDRSVLLAEVTEALDELEALRIDPSSAENPADPGSGPTDETEEEGHPNCGTAISGGTRIGLLRQRVQELPRLRKAGVNTANLQTARDFAMEAVKTMGSHRAPALQLAWIADQIVAERFGKDVKQCLGLFDRVANLALELKQSISPTGIVRPEADGQVQALRDCISSAGTKSDDLWSRVREACVIDHLDSTQVAAQLGIAGAAGLLPRLREIEGIPQKPQDSKKVVERHQRALEIRELLPREGPVGDFVSALLSDGGAELPDLDDPDVAAFVEEHGLKTRLKIRLATG